MGDVEAFPSFGVDPPQATAHSARARATTARTSRALTRHAAACFVTTLARGATAPRCAIATSGATTRWRARWRVSPPVPRRRRRRARARATTARATSRARSTARAFRGGVSSASVRRAPRARWRPWWRYARRANDARRRRFRRERFASRSSAKTRRGGRRTSRRARWSARRNERPRRCTRRTKRLRRRIMTSRSHASRESGGRRRAGARGVGRARSGVARVRTLRARSVGRLRRSVAAFDGRGCDRRRGAPRASESAENVPIATARRRAFRTLSLRWHPDKFHAAHGARLRGDGDGAAAGEPHPDLALEPGETHAEAVARRVRGIAQALNDAWKANGR